MLPNQDKEENPTETDKEKTVTDGMDKTDKPEQKLPEVRLPDSDPRAFELVLSYIYTDRIHPGKQSKSSKWHQYRSSSYSVDQCKSF